MKFLGHTISSEGISVDPTKVQEVMDWEPPTSVHQIRSFLGLPGYYYRFIPDFSRIAKPMTELLKKGVNFIWNNKCEEAFQTLKARLTTAPVYAEILTKLSVCMEFQRRSFLIVGLNLLHVSGNNCKNPLELD